MGNEEDRIQKKLDGHLYRSISEQPALDDTDRNTDKVIKPTENKRPRDNAY